MSVINSYLYISRLDDLAAIGKVNHVVFVTVVIWDISVQVSKTVLKIHDYCSDIIDYENAINHDDDVYSIKMVDDYNFLNRDVVITVMVTIYIHYRYYYVRNYFLPSN